MKGGKSNSRANQTDCKLSVRNGGGKVAKGPIKPNKPPSPTTDLDLFTWNTFKKQFRAKYPNNKSFAALSKAARVEWETMSDAATPYVEIAAKSKEEYEVRKKEFRKSMTEYVKSLQEYVKSQQPPDYNNRAATEEEFDDDDEIEDSDQLVRMNLAGLIIRQ